METYQQKGQHIIDEAVKQASDEATKILKIVEEKGHLITIEAVRVGEIRAAKMIAQAQQEAREIIEKAREQTQYDKSVRSPQALDSGFDIVAEATKKAYTEVNRILAQAKETGLQIIEEAKLKREGEAQKIVSQAEETGRQIVEEARRKAGDEGNKIVTQALQTGLQIIVEAARIADTEAERIKKISQGESKEHRLIEEAKTAAVNRLLTDARYGDVDYQSLGVSEDKVFTETMARQELAKSLLKSRPLAKVAKGAAIVPPSPSGRSALKLVKEKAGYSVFHAVLDCFSLWSKPRKASDSMSGTTMIAD